MLPDFQLYTRLEYFNDLIERIATLKKGDSIKLMTMSLDTRVPIIHDVMEALCQAAQRGVDVKLCVDALTFMKLSGESFGPIWYSRPLNSSIPEPYATIWRSLEKLRECGGSYYIINRPAQAFSNPYTNRSHIKLGVINDRVYIPSCNLDDDRNIDVVVAWDDATTAARLGELFETVTATSNVRAALKGDDLTLEVQDSVKLFVDCGVKRQSLIMRNALDLIDQAKGSVYITCQFFPGGYTAKHLEDAFKRGVAVSIHYSGPKAHGGQAPLQAFYNWRERRRRPTSFFANELQDGEVKLHAKLLASEHTTLTGSHNYVSVGVNFGTAEIALLVDDATFTKAIVEKVAQQIAATS